MSSRRLRFVLPVVLVLGLTGASLAIAAGRSHGKGDHGKSGGQFTAKLTGHQETPAVHTAGRGTLSLTINANNTISYTLTYSGLNSAASMAHVHFGQPNVAGPDSFWLCGGGGKPACPAGTGSTTATVTGTVAASDILAITTQGLNAGDFAAIVSEIRAGFAYANVHTQTSPAGEIRGQLRGGEDEQGDNGDHH